MGHEHDHHHHEVKEADINNAFKIGIALNLLFVAVELVYGLRIHSLSLLSDAGHNFADVGSLALSLLAFRLLKVRPNENYTYGYRKTSIIVALFNAFVLLLSIGAIIYEAIISIRHPHALPGKTISIIAGIGIFINALSALLFMKGKEKDLNVRSAYLHLMSDAAVSLAIVAGGVIIIFTGLYWIDGLLSLIVAAVILVSTWKMLRESLRLSLDGVPADIKVKEISGLILKIGGIKSIHHLHIWALSTTQNALTAHLVLDKSIPLNEEHNIKEKVRHSLLHHDIQHVTLETEREADGCGLMEC